MDYPEAYARLRERALTFHAVLKDTGVYQKELSEEMFLQSVEEHIQGTANDLVDGRGDPWATVLGFPDRLLFGIGDYLFECGFDAMEGAAGWYDAFQELLQQAGFGFTWQFDADAEKLEFRIGSVEWDVPCKNLRGIDEPISGGQIEPNLTDFLEKEGWFLYPVTTGDSWARYLLVPLGAKDSLKPYLIPAYGMIHPEYDPRSEWLYRGIPEDQRPANIWEL